MKLSPILKRLISGDKAIDGGAMSLRHVIVWLFIALVALFLTKPSGEPRSMFDKPVPLPAELGLETTATLHAIPEARNDVSTLRIGAI